MIMHIHYDTEYINVYTHIAQCIYANACMYAHKDTPTCQFIYVCVI